MKAFVGLARVLAIIFGTLLAVLIILLAHWSLRPNRATVDPAVVVETWDAVADGSHNSNTDLIFWRDSFYLIHASSPFHFASERSRLVLLRSPDTHSWTPIAQFDAAGEDIRDPKLAVINGRLFVYALKNTEFTAEPYQTVVAQSDDALNWTPFEEVEPAGWLFWRPKSPDGEHWIVPAYWHEHGRAVLLTSTDGIHWDVISEIYAGPRSDEPDIEFLPDGRLIATVRLEISDSYFGHPQGCTVLTTAAPPYTSWSAPAQSPVTRLDGPSLFRYRDAVYAVGRYQPIVAGPFDWQGSIFARKRTALFLVQEDRLVYLTDLPSAGDTSYSGVVIQGEDLLVSYYTSDIEHDYPWILGMVAPSNIRLARVDLPQLEALAAKRMP